MRAEILTIGDELLRGEVVDSNKSFLSDRLLQLDLETCFHSTVGDNPADIQEAFLRATDRCDLVLVSGGLGPTRDDITIDVLANTFQRKLVLDEESLETLRAFFDRLGRKMSELNIKQVYFPEGSEVLVNPIGTAPGCLLQVKNTLLFCMPGVPRELMRMMEEQVLPRIASRLDRPFAVRSALLRTFGMGESNLDEELSDVAHGDDVQLGFRTSFPDNYLRPVVRADTEVEAEAKLKSICTIIRQRLGPLVYAEGEIPMEEVVGKLLRESGQTLAIAESCTGGLIAEHITGVPGSSDYFLGGVVAYSNAAKRDLLGVKEEVIVSEGAVSESVARAMAEGVRNRFAADIAISTTGISGPGGGSEEKPVGLVWMALAREGETNTHDFLIPLDRLRHRELSAQLALDWVRRVLLDVPVVAPRFLGRKP